MPWKASDAKTHKKGLTKNQAKKWAAVANSALSKCLKDGGNQDECEASAIRQANGVAGKASESEEYPVDRALLSRTITEVWERNYPTAASDPEPDIEIEDDPEPAGDPEPETIPEA